MRNIFAGHIFGKSSQPYPGIIYHGSETALNRWASIYKSARTESIVIPWKGDSQEADDGGLGKVLVPRTNYEILRFFNSMTGKVFNNNFTSRSIDYMLRGGASQVAASNIGGDYLPPLWIPAKVASATSGLGVAVMLQHDNIDCQADAQIPADRDYFGHSLPFEVDVWVAPYSGSQEIQWQYSTQATKALSYFNTTISSGFTSAGLDAESGVIKKITLGPFTNPDPIGKPYNVIELGAASASNGADVMSMQFRRQNDPGGIHVVSVAHGGYTTADYLANHGNAGWLLKNAMDLSDVVLISTGTNDIAGGKSAATVKADMQALIAALRGTAFYDDPNLLVILFTETPRSASTSAALDAEALLLIEKQYEIADEDDHVLVVDVRAMCASAGFTRDTASPTFLLDDVHHSPLGARFVAAIIARALHLLGSA